MSDIILLHGALGSKEQLSSLGRALKKKGMKVHALNFFGHGGEPFSKEGFGIKVFSWQLQNFIRDSKLKKPNVFGYSMGGYVALRLACKFPDAMGDIFTLGTKFDWNPATAKKEAELLNTEKMEKKNPAFAESLKKLHAPNDWKELLSKTADMLRAIGKEPLLTEKEFEEIENKVTVCRGDQDSMVTLEESENAAETMPNGKFVSLAGMHHAIEKVNAEKLADVIAIKS